MENEQNEEIEQEIVDSAEKQPKKYEKPHGFKKISNFFYHYKNIFVIMLLSAALAAVFVIQFFMKEKADITIFVAYKQANSELKEKYLDIAAMLEKYCPDFDGDGKVSVAVTTANVSVDGSLTTDAAREWNKLSLEIKLYESPLIICDSVFLEDIIKGSIAGYEENSALSEVSKEKNVYVEKSALSGNPAAGLTEKTFFCVRALPVNQQGYNKDFDKRREQAEIVLQNLINGNIINQ